MMPATQPEEPFPYLDASDLNIVVLAGGVGGARLAHGLTQILPPDRLTVVVNTGDDFRHLGLTICPDLDTVMYTLADTADLEKGWGRARESWRTIDEISRLGGPDWFRLGDLDLASHLVRGQLLEDGNTLTETTRYLCQQLGVEAQVLPMSDQPAPTTMVTDEGVLSFQRWFVHHRWQPAVVEVRLPDDVRATAQVCAAIERADVVIIAPSNPFVSIDPILNVYPIRAMVMDIPDLVVAVSPIIAGQAVKGPAAKMMGEMGMAVSAESVARYYGELIDVFVCHENDCLSGETDTFIKRTDILMQDRSDRARLATEIIQFVTELLDK